MVSKLELVPVDLVASAVTLHLRLPMSAPMVTQARRVHLETQETPARQETPDRLETLERQASPAMLDRQVLLVMQELAQPPVVLVVLHLTHGPVPPGRQELPVTQEPLATQELEPPRVAQAKTLLPTGPVKTVP
jgi:hypothetical protein